ncbi:MAG: hypothetical protein PHY82_00360, partial [Lentisphaeria bacterium]|nr:hypothetical protein [Lentisphaeria bacterium]
RREIGPFVDGVFNASRASGSMWSLPSLSSPWEGIWSAAVPAASASRFAFITTNKKPQKNLKK